MTASIKLSRFTDWAVPSWRAFMIGLKKNEQIEVIHAKYSVSMLIPTHNSQRSYVRVLFTPPKSAWLFLPSINLKHDHSNSISNESGLLNVLIIPALWALGGESGSVSY